MPALAQFLKSELPRRGLSIPEFVQKAKRLGPGLSLSNAYQIIRDGKDNVETDTFELIARTLSMTPAQLMVAIGKGTEELSPILRDVLAQTTLMMEITDSIDGVSDDIARVYLSKQLDPEDYRHYVEMVLKARAQEPKQRRRSNNGSRRSSDNGASNGGIEGDSGPGAGIPSCQDFANADLTLPSRQLVSVP